VHWSQLIYKYQGKIYQALGASAEGAAAPAQGQA